MFENLGYTEDFFQNGKYVGHIIRKDNKEGRLEGYAGRQEVRMDQPFEVIKTGRRVLVGPGTYTTHLIPLCGKMINPISNLKSKKMRNLLTLALAFSVILTDEDVKELGYNVSEEDFRNYFGIPKDAKINKDGSSEFKKSEDFAIKSLDRFANAKEKKFLSTTQEEIDGEKGAKSGKSDKAAKTEKAAPKEKQFAAWKKVFCLAHLGLAENQVVELFEKEKANYAKATFNEAKNKANKAKKTYEDLTESQRTEIDALYEKGQAIEVKVKEGPAKEEKGAAKKVEKENVKSEA